VKIIEKIFDIENGKETIIERDETVAEKKQREIVEKEIEQIKLVTAEKIAQRQAILDRLGLTDDEAKLLLG
jgi:hypothetical protein